MSLPDVIRQRQDVTVTETDANTGNRRMHERLPAGLLRRVTFGGRDSVCQLYCLSEGGAQIGISNGWAPFEGTALSLWLSGDDEIKGRVVWCRGDRIGIEFLKPLASAQDVLFNEHLGVDYFCDIVRMQQQYHSQR